MESFRPREWSRRKGGATSHVCERHRWDPLSSHPQEGGVVYHCDLPSSEDHSGNNDPNSSESMPADPCWGL